MAWEDGKLRLGIIELYEYLKSSPFVGPFGTIENPVLVPAIHTERIVGCVGGTGDQDLGQRKENSSHCRAILWRGFWEEFSEVAPELLRSFRY